MNKIKLGLRIGKAIVMTKLGRPSPVFCQWEVTLRCNMSCPFCPITRTKSPWVPELNTAQALDMVDQLADMGVVILNITGGEPLLRDDLGIIIYRAKERGMMVMVACNGWFVKQKIWQLLGADEIRMSLDGIGEYHDNIRIKGSFARTVEAIKLLKSKGKKVTINSVIVQDMPYEQITGLCDLARSLDVQISLSATNLCLQTTPDPQPNQLGKQMLALRAENDWFIATMKKLRLEYGNTMMADPPAYYRIIEMGGLGRFGCQALRLSFSLKPDGSVALPCGEFPAQSLEYELKEVWKSELMEYVRHKVGRYWFCNDCRLKCYAFPSMLMNPRALIELGLSYRVGK